MALKHELLKLDDLALSLAVEMRFRCLQERRPIEAMLAEKILVLAEPLQALLLLVMPGIWPTLTTLLLRLLYASRGRLEQVLGIITHHQIFECNSR